MKMELTKRMKDWLEKCAWCDENMAFKQLFLLTKQKDLLLKVDDGIEGHEKVKSRLKHFERTVHYLKVGDKKIRAIILWEGSPGKVKGFDFCICCCSQDCADKFVEAKDKEIKVELLLPEIGH